VIQIKCQKWRNLLLTDSLLDDCFSVAGPLIQGNRAGEYLPLKNNNIVINDVPFVSKKNLL
jgi:hypothetical protein